MFYAYGWMKIRSSREEFKQVSWEGIDDLDDKLDAQDIKLWKAFRKVMKKHESNAFDWSFREELNWDRGVFHFAYMRNHRAVHLFDLLNWICENGPGSYGLVYVRDDEDRGDSKWYPEREKRDCRNEFRVWRVLNGKLEELDDPFLSPIVPTVNPTDWA